MNLGLKLSLATAGGGPSFLLPSMARLGDSITAFGTVSSKIYASSYASVSRNYSGCRYDPYPGASGVTSGSWAHAVGGYRIRTAIRDTLAPLVVADDATQVICAGGTNDFGNSLPASTTIADIVEMAQYLKAQGVKVAAIHSVPPIGDDSSGALTKGPWIADVNAGLRTEVPAAGFRLLDLESVLTGGANPGTAPTANFSDNLHPSVLGFFRIGKAEAEMLLPRLRPATFWDDGTFVTDDFDFTAANYLTAWNTSVAAGASFTSVTKEARTDGVAGNWLKIVFDNGSATTFSSLLLRSGKSPSLAPGDLVAGVCEVRGDAGWDCRGIYMEQNFWTVGSASRDGQLTGLAAAAIPEPIADVPMVFQTPRQVTGGSSANAYARIYFAGSGTYYVGRCGVMKF